LSSILPEQERADGHVDHYGVSSNWRLNVTIDRAVSRKVPPETESYLGERLGGDPPGPGFAAGPDGSGNVES
jgi:hypothetical protein